MLRLYLPTVPMRNTIDFAVVVERPFAGSVSRFPAMPRAMLTLSPVGVSGACVSFHAFSTRPAVHISDQPFKALGFVLPPCTAARLMGPSTGALVDMALPWVELAGSQEAARLDDELHHSDSDTQRLATLQRSLERVLARGPERVTRSRTQSVEMLSAAVGKHGAQAAKMLALSERQLERRCRALLGLSPKRLQRLTRFSDALGDALRERRVPNAEAAVAAGYYDQSHLARDVRELAGVGLGDLIAQARTDGEWWPLATQLSRCSLGC